MREGVKVSEFIFNLLYGIKGPEFIVIVLCTLGLLVPVIVVTLDILNYVSNKITNLLKRSK